ncbi:MAG: hypothetical protein VKO44_02880 [Cyanobacteriota bacterium]|nr:hypothetical protein [Cyanobacteriota bacterium]
MASAAVPLVGVFATAFPLTAPFRVDQVTAAPALMAAIAAAQVVLALGLDVCGRRGARRLWWAGVVGFLLLTLLFFTLGTWGTSDTTKINHALALDPTKGSVGEPFWSIIGPLILHLPYRMAFVHGLVATACAGTAIALARLWGVPAWAGWWALLLISSPLLRSFLQNGITRQALSTLLVVPLFLRLSGLVPLRNPLVALGVGGSVLTHTTFPYSLALALSPLLVRRGASRGLAVLNHPWRWVLLPGLGLAVVAVVVLVVVPVTLRKLTIYATEGHFYSSYALLPEVRRLQLAMGLGLVGACWQRRLGFGLLWRCPLTKLLVLFAVLFAVLQGAVANEWLASIAFRLSDGVGLFLIILYLAWMTRYNSLRWLWPALLVSLHSWFFLRLWPSGQLECGRDDAFLCIPDRWPWAVRY